VAQHWSWLVKPLQSGGGACRISTACAAGMGPAETARPKAATEVKMESFMLINLVGMDKVRWYTDANEGLVFWLFDN
jgi:hypothetical protein